MPSQQRTGVLVGVDGSPGSLKAVRYGALEARRLGTDLTLVHVGPDYVPMAAMRPLAPDDLAGVGRSILADARRVAAPYVEGLTVTTSVIAGAATPRLLDAAGGAQMVVLGRNTRSLLHRVFTGAVTTGVASRATCPVVSVPDTWEPHQATGRVVVGFRGSAHEGDVLGRGLVTAEARGCRLMVIHAWELPGVYDDIIVRRTHEEDWNVRALESIATRIDELSEDHPAVDVDVRIVHAQPAHALIDAAAGADLLVLVRRSGRWPVPHLGSTARAVLREAPCPVEVLPPHEATVELDDLDLESAGAPPR